MQDIWKTINEKFGALPAQLNVVKTLLTYGFSVKDDGIYCSRIKIPDVQIAKEAGVDRRVVKATIRSISGDEELRKIFSNLRAIAFLKDVAPNLGLGMIEIIARDAAKFGIITDVTRIIANAKISIRQVIADDPYLTESAKLTIITESAVPGHVIDNLRKLKHVKSVVVYT